MHGPYGRRTPAEVRISASRPRRDGEDLHELEPEFTEPMQNMLATATAFRRTSVTLTILSLALIALLAILS